MELGGQFLQSKALALVTHHMWTLLSSCRGFVLAVPSTSLKCGDRDCWLRSVSCEGLDPSFGEEGALWDPTRLGENPSSFPADCVA